VGEGLREACVQSCVFGCVGLFKVLCGEALGDRRGWGGGINRAAAIGFDAHAPSKRCCRRPSDALADAAVTASPSFRTAAAVAARA